MMWQVTSLSWVEENGFSKNPFLPIQMILENGAFFTPGLCGRGGQRRTVVPTPITVTSPPSCMVRQSQFQAFCSPGQTFTREVGNLKSSFHLQRTCGAVSLWPGLTPCVVLPFPCHCLDFLLPKIHTQEMGHILAYFL